MARSCTKLFPNPDDEQAVFDMILDYSELEDVAVSHAIDALNAEIKKQYGCTVTKGWFSKAARKKPERMERWAEIWKVKEAMTHEEANQREKEFIAKIGKNQTITTKDKNGRKSTRTRRVLEKVDVAAYRVVDQSQRRRIAMMMPKFFRQPPARDGVSGGILSFQIDLSPKDEDETGDDN